MIVSDWALMSPSCWPTQARRWRLKPNGIAPVKLKTQAVGSNQLRDDWLGLHDGLVLTRCVNVRLGIPQDTNVCWPVPFPREENQVAGLSGFVVNRNAITVPKFVSVPCRPLKAILPNERRHSQAGGAKHKPHKPRAVKATLWRLPFLWVPIFNRWCALKTRGDLNNRFAVILCNKTPS